MLGLKQRLSHVGLFESLDDAELERVMELSETRLFPPDAVMLREQLPADALWVVLTGDVEVSRDGRVLAELGPGSALGELSLFTHQARRSATVRAICAVEALRIPVDPFRKMLAAHDLAALKMVSNLAHQMAQRLVALNDRLLSEGKKGLAVARSELRRTVL
ncbi:MAG: cyclic nucleotide-binding domain-containing protein [Archangium sp.]